MPASDIASITPFSRRRLLAAAAAAIALSTTPHLSAAGESAEQYALRIGGKVIALARSGATDAELKRRFLALLTRNADIRAVARFALGKYRRRMPRELMPEYYRLVLGYIAGLFVWYRKDLAATGIEAVKSHTRGKWTTVETRLVFPGGQKTRVLWRIYTAGPMRVGDLNIKGIWLSLRMRDKFVSILNEARGDFGALMRYLRENAV